MSSSRWTILAALTLAACATTDAARPTPAPAKAPAPAPEQPRIPRPAATEPVPWRPWAESRPLEIVAIPVPNKPIISFRLLFRAGSVDDPKGKEGLTALTGSVLAEGGTKELSSAELLHALYPMAAELTMLTDKEFTVLEGRVHRDFADRFLKILTDVLLEPRFDPSEFARLKAKALTEVKSQLRHENDEQLGKVALDALLYAGHPYGHYVGGTVEGLESITLDDVRAQARRVFTQDRLLVGLAGAVDGALEEKVRARLSQLPEKGAPQALPPAPGRHGRAVIVQKPAMATAISMGAAYPVRRGDPDFFPLYFAMSYLGEHRSMAGVLFTELRQRRGLNYGDYAYAENFTQEGGSMLPSPNVARSIQDFSLWIRPVPPATAMFAARGAVHFLAELAKAPIPRDAFDRHRKLLDGLTRQWEVKDQRRLGYALDDRVYGTHDFLEEYRAALQSMTPEQVQGAVRRHLAPDRLDYAFVAQDAAALKKLLVEQPPTPLAYASPKPQDVLDEDQLIQALPLPLDPADVAIVDAASFMQRAPGAP